MSEIEIPKSNVQTLKLRVGNYKYPVQVENRGNTLWLKFAFNRALLEEIKAMEGSRWHGFEDPPVKAWSIKNSPRNWFQLRFLMGENVYERYDKPLIDFKPWRKKKHFPEKAKLFGEGYDPESYVSYAHQIEMSAHGLTRHYGIWGAEMGTGKTLAAIDVMETSGFEDWWWIGPKSALRSVKLEFIEWRARFTPRFLTYEQLVKVIKDWQPGESAPKGLIIDESSRAKNPTAQRSQSCAHLANSIRAEHGDNGFVIEMSGSPSPKSPVDWWHQAEIACPGFLREGDVNKFKNRLGIVTSDESITGGKFARLVSWKDDASKCNVCGLPREDDIHKEEEIVSSDGELVHKFIPSINEVTKLYNRLKGLVYIKFKRDCIDLPKKIYKIIRCKPNQDIINAARLIALTAKSSIEAQILLRELSDGFQYKDTETKIPCIVCNGKQLENDAICHGCHNQGYKIKVSRETIEVACPKDEEVLNILDQFDEQRRFIFYAGFTGSIDRLFKLCTKATWKVIRVDGRGWYSPEIGTDEAELYKIFKSDSDERIAFVAHPGSGGMGLNFPLCPGICYYSNDFNGESRIQSEERTNRLGSKGDIIFDLFHLPTDELVYDSLKKKRELQALTLNDIQAALIMDGDRRV